MATLFTALTLSAAITSLPKGVAQPAKAAASAKNPYVTARLLSNVSAIEAGKPFRLGVELTMQPGWHTYYKEPGDAGMPTRIEWKLPPGFTARSLKWERPTRMDEEGIITFGYKDKTLIAAEIEAPAQLPLGEELSFGAVVKYLSCREICIPGESTVSLKEKVVAVGSSQPTNTEAFAAASFDGSNKEIAASSPQPAKGSALPEKTVSLLTENYKLGDSGKPLSLIEALGFAFLGGIILNFMPCVLPVLAIKLLSCIEHNESTPVALKASGIFYSLGVLFSFLSLAGIVIGAQSAGNALGWGFAFQYPPFLIAMSALVLLFSLSLFGLFHVNAVGQESVGKLAERDGPLGNFFKGVLATILSTPCTAPFLGAALGFAFVQPPLIVASIFFAAGIGMSLPYLLIVFNPKLLKVLPKPGAWMEQLKELMGFILLATVVWLLSTLALEISIEGVVAVLYFLVVLSFAVWFTHRFAGLNQSAQRVWTIRAVAIGLVALSAYALFFTQPNIFKTGSNQASAVRSGSELIAWQPFDLNKANQEIASGHTVFIDFTAQWCLTCKANEAAVLNTQPVADRFKALHIVPMRADWTNQDATITQLLRKFNRSGVPLYVIFPANRADQPLVLPEVITSSIVLENLEKAGPSRSSSK
jgi:thiol:disulfide interchange protein DsbD